MPWSEQQNLAGRPALAQQNGISTDEIDILVVGAGFSGIYLLYTARKAGFSVKLYEAGSHFGGVWHLNRYPGARADTDYITYQYSLEELWKDWTWTERYAPRKEIVEYFEYVDSKLDLRRDISFNTSVTAAEFDPSTDRWAVSTSTGTTTSPRFLIMCTGYRHKPNYPKFKGLENFKGITVHTSRWPREGIETAGKRVGVIGTGPSGVQVIQECGPQASHLTVFQRSLNTAVPMRLHSIDKAKEDKIKQDLYPIIFRRRLRTSGGWDAEFKYDNFFHQTPERIQQDLQKLWESGLFRIWVVNYDGILSDHRGNDIIYKFWRDQIIQRIHDPEKHKLLAPPTPPHNFGTRRPTLEQTYYEIYNLPHVDLVDLKSNPITEVTDKGIKTQDGAEHALDVLVLATGFGAFTSSMASIDIKGMDVETIGEKWRKNGASSYLGMTSHGYPNLFFVYGPQGPTGTCTGSTCAEIQGDWIVKCMEHMRHNRKTRIEPDKDAQEKYSKLVNDTWSIGIGKHVNSGRDGDNILEKPKHAPNFTGGLPAYMELLRKSVDSGYEGFIFGTSQ